MQNKQAERFDRLRELAEQFTSSHPDQGDDFQGYNIPELINELQIYQAELEIQNDELRAAQSELEHSRTRLSRLFHRAPVGYALLDAVGMIVDVNQTLCSLLQTEQNTLVGKPFSRQILAADQPIFLGRFKSFYKNPKNKVIEVRLNRQDERPFFARLEGRFHAFNGESDDDGQQQLLLMISDITEQKNAEEALRASEARWQFALEGARDGVWDWNAETNEVFFSRRWIEMLGYEPREISSDLHEWERRVHPEDMPAVRRDLENHFQGKTAYYQNEHRMLCKDGSYKWVLDRGKVVEWTEDGRPRRVIGTHADIAEQKQREAEREALIRELQEAMSEVKTLSGLLPICANCKKIRDDQGYWNQIETYIQQHSEAEFSHGICRECAEKLYPDLQLYDD
jgi:PAS domain S-box-containing protein